MFLSGFLTGLAAIPAFAILIFLISLTIPAFGKYRNNEAVYFGHKITGVNREFHEHRYSKWSPMFISKLRFAIESKHCVFSALEQTPDGVWAAEIAYLVSQDPTVDTDNDYFYSDGNRTPAQTAANKKMFDLYRFRLRFGNKDIFSIINYSETALVPVAKAQLSREKQGIFANKGLRELVG